MRIINPSFEFVNTPDVETLLSTIEKAYRICYLSESKGDRDAFITSKVRAGHESPLEHSQISVIATTNRGVANEIVRHRVASYCQESTRYCNYSKERLGGEICFIRPIWCSEELVNYPDVDENSFSEFEKIWVKSCKQSEENYLALIGGGYTAQQARNVLNHSLSTRIMITMNVREWRHFFKLRALGTTGAPHPEMLQLTIPMLEEFQKLMPSLFGDLVK